MSSYSAPVVAAVPVRSHTHHRHPCWKSITAGMAAALAIQLVLTMFCAAIAASLVNPATDPDPTKTEKATFAIAAVVWLILSGVVSFGIGGMIAGCHSGGTHEGLDSRRDADKIESGSGAAHGFLAWAAAAVLGAVVATLAGSMTAGGAAAGAGASAAGAPGMGSSWNFMNITSGSSGWRFANASDNAGPQRAGEIVIVGPYGQRRVITEAEARRMAETAAEAASKASLATGVAFSLSAAAAIAGGAIGRKRHNKQFGL